jgi:hypothetical protein
MQGKVQVLNLLQEVQAPMVSASDYSTRLGYEADRNDNLYVYSIQRFTEGFGGIECVSREGGGGWNLGNRVSNSTVFRTVYFRYCVKLCLTVLVNMTVT